MTHVIHYHDAPRANSTSALPYRALSYINHEAPIDSKTFKLLQSTATVLYVYPVLLPLPSRSKFSHLLAVLDS